MKITTRYPIQVPARSLPSEAKPNSPSPLAEDRFQLSPKAPDPAPSPEPENHFGSRVLGGFAGALAGILAGHAGPGGVALVAGGGAAAVSLSEFGPMFKESLEASQTGDLFNDLVMTCGTLAAGGFLLATAAGAAGGLAYPLAAALPAAAPVIGGVVGAGLGAYFGIRN